MKLVFTYSFLILMALSASAQNNALILNNSVVINLNDGGVISINQSNASGISLIGSADGYIQSEGEPNRVAWHINGGTGNYVIPFGVAATGTKIDMTYSVTTAGSTTGTLMASTYATANNNTVYPSLFIPFVSNMDLRGSGGDHSLYAVDRFWVLRKANWSTDPVSNLTFTYRDIEFAPANTIAESNLLAQYWDGSQWTPAMNSVTPLLGVNNATANQVNTINAGNGNFYTWILSDKSSTLPVELLSVDARCSDLLIPEISWTTASETNNHFFTIERSVDDFFWTTVATISGAGNSGLPLHYIYLDNNAPQGNLYYKLSQTNFDGSSENLGVMNISCSDSNTDNSFGLNAYCDDAQIIHLTFNCMDEFPVFIRIFDLRGRLVHSEIFQPLSGMNHYKTSVVLQDALYLINLSGESHSESVKVVKQQVSSY